MLDRGADPAVVQARLEQVASLEGLAFGKRSMTFNSRLAQEVGKWAECMGRGEEFHNAVFKACLVEGKNIALASTLLDVAVSAGLSEVETEKVIEKRQFKGQVESDWSHCKMMNVIVVPTLALGDKTLAGAHPYEKMERFLRDNNIRHRNITDKIC
ncbi:DSBA oxidoreductase (fragment) [uncultured Desulfobacterium sp.]|uniref:DSBA oxidoreductase n=1 Tax=uncultured Desulfobacterium sp. TaxID=201089 RepID=A0A445N146_9BACT